MPEWTARIQITLKEPAASRADLPPLPEGLTLTDYASTDARAELQADAIADDLQAATCAVLDTARQAVDAWPGNATFTAVDVMSVDARRRLAEHPQPLDLVDATGAGRILKVTRQRVEQLARDNPDFPEHVAKLTRGKVYSVTSIEAFKARWSRSTGRPPKASA